MAQDEVPYTATVYDGATPYVSGPIEIPNRRGTVYVMHYEPVGRTINKNVVPGEKDIAYYIRGDTVFEVFDSRYSPLLIDRVSQEVQSPMARVGQSLPAELVAWIIEGDLENVGTSAPPLMVDASTSPIVTPRQASSSTDNAPHAHLVSPRKLSTLRSAGCGPFGTAPRM